MKPPTYKTESLANIPFQNKCLTIDFRNVCPNSFHNRINLAKHNIEREVLDESGLGLVSDENILSIKGYSQVQNEMTRENCVKKQHGRLTRKPTACLV